MNIENRLRAELERTGRSTKVGVAPSIDELAAIANERRHRNRVLGTSGAVVMTSALLFGAFFATQADDPTTLEVAGAGVEESAEASDAEAAASVMVDEPSANGQDQAAEAVEDDPPASDDAGDPSTDPLPSDESASPATTIAETAAETGIANAGGAALLQLDDTPMTVESQESAVGLASGSGVLVADDGQGGYVGLALSFANDSLAIGLRSDNGLDWTEVELSGVPAGATASVLRSYDGTYVALFERFDQNSGLKQHLIGTSTDLADWDVSAPLPGGEVFATDLAVGSNGVVVIGDDEGPDVWTGPLGGPYEWGDRLDAVALSGVTTLDGEFLVAGRSAELGLVLFRSADGVDWIEQPLSSPGVDGAFQEVTLDQGTIVLTNVTDDGPTTLISGDGGTTWSALASSSSSVTVSASTLGFLGSASDRATVAVADGDTFATAQIDVAAPDRLTLIAAGNDELVLLQSTDGGAPIWIVASRN